MIKTAIVAMTIVGCDCDAKLCEYISESPAQWTSVADCEAAIGPKVIRSPGVDYPLVTGICREVSKPSQTAPTTPVVEQAAIDNPSATTDGRGSIFDAVRSGGGALLRKTTDGYGVAKAGVGWAAERIVPDVLASWLPATGD